jgi:hypothetical protein
MAVSMNPPSGFYVVAKEPGAEHPALPTWANENSNPAQLDPERQTIAKRVEIDNVPGAYQLLDVLSREECDRLIKITEALGYLPDAAVSLPRSVRHNYNATWVVDEQTDGILWGRCKDYATDNKGYFGGKKPLGLNARFRFYRYESGDYFAPHTDGGWPGSRVIDRQLVPDAYQDRFSLMTVLFFLSDAFEGGETQFWVNKNDPSLPARSQDEAELVDVKTPAGGALCFPHGAHPLHCLHSSEKILSGVKYIIRTDMLFESLKIVTTQ